MPLSPFKAPGRLADMKPFAVVDIGSNSVRLVAYEGLSRAPTPIFNDKAMCGLGRGVATTGMLNEDGARKAIAALERFRVLCTAMHIKDVYVVATAAARDASNGPAFLEAARKAIKAPIELLSGIRESRLAAFGVICGFKNPDGVIGDLGGGSLELNRVWNRRPGKGVSLPVGGLSLIDRSGGSPKKAARLVRQALGSVPWLDEIKGKPFYAVGGTWRSLARLHMVQRNYPLNVMHGYEISARDASDFAMLVERISAEALIGIETISSGRRPLLAYGAVVLDEIMRRAKPSKIIISALGLREGVLYDKLADEVKKRDALIEASRELNILRSRAPAHGEELMAWTDVFMSSTGLDETSEEKRLRHAACLLADIGWRAHPDYRGEQSFNIIANAAFVGIDHPGRAFLAIANFYRHTGEADISIRLRQLASARLLDRAHILGAAMRVAYVLSAAMPDVLPHAPLVCKREMLSLTLPKRLAPLGNSRVLGRMKELGRLIGRAPELKIAK
ncbi:MAG: exopolyphosphatase [Beijerinckiaceae bacterium]|jgi:exopolyphosphatase / guanosine-5'-triphosphate,3'-diphosphate pyrophosphatase|nr:exopolyphosphatase [Beijerinckiaceae bacterium]